MGEIRIIISITSVLLLLYHYVREYMYIDIEDMQIKDANQNLLVTNEGGKENMTDNPYFSSLLHLCENVDQITKLA